jgi:hypothetical protein
MSADHPRRSRAISCPPPAGALGRRISPSKSLICGYVFSAHNHSIATWRMNTAIGTFCDRGVTRN